jgi:hypothetical protein
VFGCVSGLCARPPPAARRPPPAARRPPPAARRPPPAYCANAAHLLRLRFPRAVNFLFSFIIGQTFLSMLCTFRWYAPVLIYRRRSFALLHAQRSHTPPTSVALNTACPCPISCRGVFLFFAAWVAVATIFIFFLLPETKGVPVERVQLLFAEHPIWRRVMGPAAGEIIAHEKGRADQRAINAAERANDKASVVSDGKGGAEDSTIAVTAAGGAKHTATRVDNP